MNNEIRNIEIQTLKSNFNILENELIKIKKELRENQEVERTRHENRFNKFLFWVGVCVGIFGSLIYYYNFIKVY